MRRIGYAQPLFLIAIVQYEESERPAMIRFLRLGPAITKRSERREAILCERVGTGPASRTDGIGKRRHIEFAHHLRSSTI